MVRIGNILYGVKGSVKFYREEDTRREEFCRGSFIRGSSVRGKFREEMFGEGIVLVRNSFS